MEGQTSIIIRKPDERATLGALDRFARIWIGRKMNGAQWPIPPMMRSKAMSEADDRQRWQAMLEELGIPPEPEYSPSSAKVNEEKPANPESKAGEASTSEVQSELVDTPGADRPTRGRKRRRSGREKVVEPLMESETGENPTPPVPSAEEEEKQSPGRRRRRRGRRGKGAITEDSPKATPTAPEMDKETPEVEYAEAEAQECSFGEEPPEAANASRNEAPEERPAFEEEETPEELVPAGLVDEEDDEELDDLSGWSVPSWADLVAGLYRPPDR
jgi:hypothetical protein